MEKIPVAKIIEFRRKKSDGAKATLINNVKKPRKKEGPSDGGDYWTTSVSSIGRLYKTDNSDLIVEKINDLLGRHDLASAKISKNMYQRNIEILHNFEDFDFSDLKPNLDLTYISKPVKKSIIKVNGVPVQVRPQHVYTYVENNIEKIGGVWFVAKKDGFKPSEIGVFTEALYQYLKINYSKDFMVDSDFCIALDVTNLTDVRYIQIQNKEIPSLLNSSVDEIRKFI